MISGSLTQAIRNFAKSLENWLKSAMVDVPEDMVKTKVSIPAVELDSRSSITCLS